MNSLQNRLRCYVGEYVGTFLLVSVGPGSAMIAAKTGAFGHEGVALAFGLVVMLCVASLGHISGAHINPAVTLGFWTIGRFPTADVIPYIFAQSFGAISSSFLLGWIVGPFSNFGATIPALPVAQSFAVEFGYTAVLGFVIMAVATDERSPKGIAPFVIGGTVYVGALVTGPLTGGSFNPARSLGPAVRGGIWTAHWLYWIAPVFGMMLGMKLYNFLRPTDAPVKAGPLGVEGSIQS